MKRTVTTTVCTFRAVRTEAGFDPTGRFVVCPWGTVQTRKGPVTVNEKTLSMFKANQKAMRRDNVAGDFNHNTLRGIEPVKVAGYWVPDCVRGEGIVVEFHHGTPDLQYVTDGHYPDISPAIERDANGVVESLHSFAFCRHGEMAHPELEIFSVEVPAPPQKSPTKKPTTPMTDTEMLAEMFSALGVDCDPDASPESKLAALAKAKEGITAKAAPTPMTADEKQSLTALSAEVSTLKNQITALSTKDGERSVDSLIADATTAGKQIGLKRERLVAMGADTAKEYLDSLPAGVVTSQVSANNATLEAANKGKTGAGAAITEVFSADTLKMFRRNGLDPAEMLEAHNTRLAALSADDAEPDPEAA